MTLTYVKAGGPPDYWRIVRVVDLDTGTEVAGVIEADTSGGWLTYYARDQQGRLKVENGELVIERRQGRFELRTQSVTDTLFDAIHDAGLVAQIVRANGLMIVNGVVYGAAGHGINVTFAAHTQALAELRDTQVDNESLRAENAALRAQLSAPRGGGVGRGVGQADEDFGGELIDAGDR